MNTTAKNLATVRAVEALVAAAAEALEAAAVHMANDANTIEDGEHGQNNTERLNFSVGALLPLETLAEQLQAILTAARAIQAVRS